MGVKIWHLSSQQSPTSIHFFSRQQGIFRRVPEPETLGELPIRLLSRPGGRAGGLTTLIITTMFLRTMNPRALAHLSRTAPAAVANAAVAAAGVGSRSLNHFGTTQQQTRRTRPAGGREYSSTRRAEMNYLPMVLESTPRGERAYDIYSRLLRVCSWLGGLLCISSATLQNVYRM